MMCDALFPMVVVIGSLMGFTGTLAYLGDAPFGGTEPDRVSWLVWCVAHSAHQPHHGSRG